MPRGRRRAIDPKVLEAALVGLELRRDRIDKQLAEVRRLIAGRGPRKAAKAPTAPVQKRPRFSAAALKRIAAAQKKRWAEWRKKRGKAGAKAKK
jgi:hypothetical protein